MALRTITLLLDEQDYDTIQNEVAYRQRLESEGIPGVADGDSNLIGAVVAEAIRDLDEYRALADLQLGEDE